ncbi:FAD binding domain-containing protein [Streptomyces sp. NPDC087894]|uniref:FAD binding domain-containing protein n=1 Tax=Streptomyces sp. NPDC087894 TaxID=3365816 RepID=UPI0038045A5D
MKPALFDYVMARTVPEAVEALSNAENAKVLAGGQSLILEMHLKRASTPHVVVDINRITSLGRVEVDDGVLRVGALVRHRAFEDPHAVPGPLGELFARTVVNIAHPPIRNRGTMAGSFGWAHPASEWCGLAVALDADVELAGADSTREVAARDFFKGPHETVRQPQEMITAVRWPLLSDDTGVGFVEHRRTHFCFAQVAVGATLNVRGGVIQQAKIGLVNCADRPLRAHAAEASLNGAEVGPMVDGYRVPPDHPFARAGRVAAEEDAAPIAEPYADIEYRKHAIATVVTRTLCQAAADQQTRAEAQQGDSA